MNECGAVRRLLAKRPTEWSDRERKRVTSHLAGCTDCTARAHDYAEQDRRLGALPPVSLTGMQRQELHMRLERARRWHMVRSRLSAAAVVVLGVAALVAIILLASFLLRASGPGNEPITGTTPVVRLPTPSPLSPYPELSTPTQEGDYPPPPLPAVEGGATATAASAPAPPTQPPPGP